jgi:putative salt-induced outer membrane protein
MSVHGRFISVLRLALFVALMAPAAFADQVILKNGDRLTGAIKKVDQGVLVMDYYKREVEIPWAEVASLESATKFHLVLKDGQVVVGTVKGSPTGLAVTTEETGTVSVALDSIQTLRSPEGQAAYEAELERLRNPRLRDLWSGFLDTGLAMSRGNSDVTTLNVSLSAARTSPRDKISAYITSLYSRSNASGVAMTTANAIRGGVRYDVNIRPRLFGFGSTDLEYDEFQGLDLRFVPAGGLGFHWVKSDRTRFDVFGGGALNREFYVNDINRTSGEIVVGEELFYQVAKAAHLEHQLTFYPNLSETGEYRLNLDNAFVTALSTWLSWQLSLSDRLNSDPIPGKKKNDVLFTTGLRFTFQ